MLKSSLRISSSVSGGTAAAPSLLKIETVTPRPRETEASKPMFPRRLERGCPQLHSDVESE